MSFNPSSVVLSSLPDTVVRPLGGQQLEESGPPGTPFLWYKAGVECFNDAGVTPAGDGDGVQEWHDQGSVGLDIAQVVGVNRPTLRTDYASSGKPGLEFVLSPTQYLEASGEPDLIGPITVLAAIYLNASGAGEIINTFFVNTANANQLRFAVQATDEVVMSRPYSSDATGTDSVPRSQWVVVAAKVGPAGSPDTLLYSDGSNVPPQSVTLNDDGVHNTGDLWVGRFDSQFFDANMEGAIGEILVYNSELSSGDMNLAIAYLEGQHGI